MNRRLFTTGLLLAAVLLLCACVSVPTPADRRATADALAAAHGWHGTVIPAGRFDLIAYLPNRFARGDTLTLYIEGDGLAWLGPSTPSSDPTPLDPLGLKLALAQPQGNAAYLARPCQYGDAAAQRCPERYWTGARFAPEVIASANRALDRLKARFGARRLILVGYSGGGAVATLLAERRTDVDHLVTVSGNLDPRAWTTYQRITPLYGSLDPVDDAARLAGLPQTHFVGARDRVIPPALDEKLPVAIRGVGGRNLHIVPGFDHHCCWAKAWPRLFDAILPAHRP